MTHSLRLKVIGCEVLTREISYCMSDSPHVTDIVFTPKGAHDDSDKLRELIQTEIDEADQHIPHYDAILLGFGLCGNSINGIRAGKTRIIIPKAHDCCTLFLGSRSRFKEIFGDRPSTPFTSGGYLERGGSLTHEGSTFAQDNGFKNSYQEYVELYGEEHAKYLWETLHQSVHEKNPEIIFIDQPEWANLGFLEKCKDLASVENLTVTEERGEMTLIKNLLHGNWDNGDFLVLEPGQQVEAVYDWDEIIRVRS